MTMTPNSTKPGLPLHARARGVSFLGILAVSTASIIIRYAQAAGGPSLLIAAGRMLVAAAVLLGLVAVFDRAHLRRVSAHDLLLSIISGLFLALHFAAWITSLELTSVASSVVLVTTTPLWVSLASTILLREPPRRQVLAGMLVALVGTGVVALSESCRWEGGIACSFGDLNLRSTALRGDTLALVGAWMVSGYFLIGRSLRPRMPLRVYALLTYGTAGLVLLAVLGIARIPLAPYAGEVYVWILALGLIPQLLGHSAFNWALRYLSATLVTVAVLGEPIGSILLAWLLLGEAPTLMQIAGGVLILGGIVVASQSERHVPEPDSSPTHEANHAAL